MASAIRVSVIGAGSAQFSLGLVKDLCLTESLAGSEVCFMDIDQGRLEMIHKLAARFAGELGADLRFARTTEREVALHEADFVIDTAAVKSHHHQRAVRDLAGFVDGEEPSTWSTTVDLGPSGAPVLTRWGRHPWCGCAWDGFLDLP